MAHYPYKVVEDFLEEYDIEPKLESSQVEASLQVVPCKRMNELVNMIRMWYGFTAVHLATFSDHQLAVQWLFRLLPAESKYRLLRIQNCGGNTGLHYTARHGPAKTAVAMLEGMPSRLVLQLLNIHNDHHQNPFDLASEYKNKSVLNIFQQHLSVTEQKYTTAMNGDIDKYGVRAKQLQEKELHITELHQRLNGKDQEIESLKREAMQRNQQIFHLSELLETRKKQITELQNRLHAQELTKSHHQCCDTPTEPSNGETFRHKEEEIEQITNEKTYINNQSPAVPKCPDETTAVTLNQCLCSNIQNIRKQNMWPEDNLSLGIDCVLHQLANHGGRIVDLELQQRSTDERLSFSYCKIEKLNEELEFLQTAADTVQPTDAFPVPVMVEDP